MRKYNKRDVTQPFFANDVTPIKKNNRQSILLRYTDAKKDIIYHPQNYFLEKFLIYYYYFPIFSEYTANLFHLKGTLFRHFRGRKQNFDLGFKSRMTTSISSKAFCSITDRQMDKIFAE